MASPRANQAKNSPLNPRDENRIEALAETELPMQTHQLHGQSTPFEIDLQASGEVVRMPAAAQQASDAPADVPSNQRAKSNSSGDYEPPVTALQQRNTARLLPARYSDSVLNRLADTPEDLQAIFELDNATNDRLIAEANGRLGITARELVAGIPYARIINAAFAHPHPQGARFSTPFRGAWYAGFELATAKAEVLFHRSIQLAEIQWHSREDLDYDHYQADFVGSFHDLRPGTARHTRELKKQQPGSMRDATELEKQQHVSHPASSPRRGTHASTFTHAQEDSWQRIASLNPDSYRFSQELAVHLLEAGSLGVVYPSARRAGGTCIACFRPGLVANVRKRDMHRLSWFPDQSPVFVRVSRTSH